MRESGAGRRRRSGGSHWRQFCDVPESSVIANGDAKSIYEVPLMLEKEGLAEQTLSILGMEQRKPNLEGWERLVERLYRPKREVEVAIVGKYVSLTDAYLSVVEALRHASIETESNLKVRWISSEDIERDGPAHYLSDMAGIVVPGGFGTRGVDGKIQAIRYARENRIPFLGLCLGMQCASIEWARYVADLDDANSAEFEPTCQNPIIALLPEQEDVVDLGGTMRLGLYPCRIEEGSLAHRLYGREVVYERHRHRYEFNNSYRTKLVETGYRLSGTSLDGRLVEIIEMPDHPFFLATQFHPEFQSRPSTPHPLFVGFLGAALEQNPEKKVEHGQNGNGAGTEPLVGVTVGEAIAHQPEMVTSEVTGDMPSNFASEGRTPASEVSAASAIDHGEDQNLSAFADASGNDIIG